MFILHINAPHFCAGAIFDDRTRKCVMAAPIIGWMVGKSPKEVITYIRRKKWEFEWSRELSPHAPFLSGTIKEQK